ncbi:MAG: HAMP domain-containing protein [Flavobacteriales bacterium]|nr:HAMP domain-containing protein [Flavobacteriales bacterium]
MSIRQRLTLGTLFLFALLLLSAGLGIFQLGRLARDAQEILKDNYETARYVQEMQQALQQGDRSAFETALKKQEANITEPGEAELTANLRSDFANWTSDSAATDRLHKDLQEVLDLNLSAIDRKNTEAMATAQRARGWLWGIAALVLVVGLIFSLGFPRIITRPIQRLQHAVEEISEGNYRHRVPAFRGDELGSLAEAFNAMSARLEQWESSNLARVMTEKTRAEAVLNSLEDAGIGTDEQGSILFVNRKATELLGMAEAELTGRSASAVAERNDLLRHVLGNNGNAPFKAVIDGREQFFAGVRFPIEGPTGNLGTVYLLRNITPFQERDEAKTRFLATITHELKTPLASSDIGLSLLERGGAKTEQQSAILADLRKDHQRLVRIVSELLDMAQVESGKVRLAMADHALADIVRDATDALHANAEARLISIEIRIDPEDLRVHADGEKATWALINILSNALRFAPERSSITIAGETGKNQVTLSITDRGPGLSDEQRAHLFERFGPHSGTGTGLGLSIARDLMRAMGGDIQLQSSSERGSVFTLRFAHASADP